MQPWIPCLPHKDVAALRHRMLQTHKELLLSARSELGSASTASGQLCISVAENLKGGEHVSFSFLVVFIMN